MDPYPRYLMRVWICVSRVPNQNSTLSFRSPLSHTCRNKDDSRICTIAILWHHTRLVVPTWWSNSEAMYPGKLPQWRIMTHTSILLPQPTSVRTGFQKGSSFLKSFESHSSGC